MECIEGIGCRNNGGYIKKSWEGKSSYAHRVAYAKANGLTRADLDGKVVRHTCDNPPCVNPAHLVIGTASDNMQDAVKRGRHKPGHARKLTMEQATAIRTSASPYALGREYGVTDSVVRYILAGKTYK